MADHLFGATAAKQQFDTFQKLVYFFHLYKD